MRETMRLIRICTAMLSVLAILGGCASNRQQTMVQENEYRRMMEKQKAEAALEEAVVQKLPAMTADEYERIGDRYLTQGNRDMAFVQYHKALQMDPRLDRVRYKVGSLFLERGMVKEAQAEFQEIVKHQPDSASAYDGLGRASFHLREFEEAEKYFNQSLKLNPASWQTCNGLGILYDRQGRAEDAIQQFEKAISLRPNDPQLYNNLGMSLLRSDENEKAVRAFTEALKAGEPHPKVYNNLALALCRLGRYPEALEAFKKSGDDASAYYHLGCFFLARKKYREAIDSFDRAIELAPGFHVKAYEKKQEAKTALTASF
jgi:Tfp pilus assembly protein PilF